MDRLTTELALENWRYGQAQAERLSAGVLILDRFESVDPQAPLGGPDGLKDVLCERGGKRYVAAAFYPTTTQRFSQIKGKFRHDLAGVDRNRAHGLVFLTNQRLTPGERRSLEAIAEASRLLCIIYHLERLRAVLDTPAGYGLRLEFLRIPMTLEEQVSFFANERSDVLHRLQEQGAVVRELRDQMLELAQTQALILDAISPSQPSETAITANLSLDILLMLHRGISSQIGSRLGAGQLRNVRMWIGPAGGAEATATHVPPEPTEAKQLLADLLATWNRQYASLRNATLSERINAIADFHHRLVWIHPFLDANGAVARELTKHQVSDLIGSGSFDIDDRQTYYAALAAADAGDPMPLRQLFRDIISRDTPAA